MERGSKKRRKAVAARQSESRGELWKSRLSDDGVAENNGRSIDDPAEPVLFFFEGS